MGLFTSCVNPAVKEAQRLVVFSQAQMGVPFELRFYVRTNQDAEAIARRAFKRVEELNQHLSDYETDSELNHFSRTAGAGQWVSLGDDLWFLLERSQKLAKETGGAFDVTAAPMVNRWRKARREKRLPSEAHLAAARSVVGYTNLLLWSSEKKALLQRAGMKLDLGGIAKGYAADEALKVLQTNGIKRALVAAAGDIAVGLPPPGKEGWRIALASEKTNAIVILKNGSVSTSGDVFQNVEIDGIRYSHIVDPKTGLGLTNSPLVTVIARDGTTADSLATALSILTPEAGLRLLKRYPRSEARILTLSNGVEQIFQSPGFKKYLVK